MFMMPRGGNPRKPGSSGKLHRIDRPGVIHFHVQNYLGYSYQISQRTVGMTVRRKTYSVSIRYPDGSQAVYLENHRSQEAAEKETRIWIEKNTRMARQGTYSRLTEILKHARQLKKS